jgi:curved DNA-binding protein CbpA
MTDYFTLLQQPRQPWLDPDNLKEAFHTRARNAHPDAELNEAYQVLRDPKRRLHHLLTLQGEAPSSRGDQVPPKIEALFPSIAAVTRDADALVEKVNKTTNALSRSLARAAVESLQKQITDLATKISDLRNEALVRLQSAAADDCAELRALYLQFSYLNRWSEQLEERRVRLFI